MVDKEVFRCDKGGFEKCFDQGTVEVERLDADGGFECHLGV